MLSERWRLTEKILMEAWEAPAEARACLVEERCGADEALLAEVRSLLEAQVAADNWTPPAEAISENAVPSERRAGPYRLGRLIGRGGAGSVYLGSRADEEFEQQVAVKIIHLAFDADPFDRRFRQERQILASLSHPNIAHVIDGGVTSEGDLYLAMEYVDGLPLDQFMDERRLSIDQRIAVLLKVCDAVEFAHRSLIIHRDLKPSNILVTATGEPKLLDFGTARMLSVDAGSAATIPMMTPRYASPEQLRGLPMTTATDVYSLGVIAYELMTGDWPFGGIPSQENALQRAVRDATLIAPSDAVTAAASEARATPPAALKRILEGDLTTILTKSLQTDPAHRYGSVQEFSADLARYRAGLPILARPQTLSYRARKFAGRNKLALAAAGLLSVAVLAGAASTLWQARRAERRFEDVRQLAKYMVFEIHDNIQQLPAATTLQRQVVERSLAYLDRLSAEASTDSSLRLEVAEGYQRLGDVLGNPFRSSLGDRDRARQTYGRALAAVDSVLAKEPSDVRARRLAASIRVKQAGPSGFGGNAQDAREQTAKAVTELKSLAADRPEDGETSLALATALDALARQWSAGGGLLEPADSAKAAALYEEASTHLKHARQRRPGNAAIHLQLAQNRVSAGNLWGSTEPSKALAQYQSALGWLSELPAERSQQLDARRLRATVLLNIGWAQGQLGSYREAIRSIDGSAKLLEALAAVDPENATAHYQLTGVLRARGLVHSYDKNYAAAIKDFHAAAEIHQRLSEKDPANGVYRYLRAELLVRLGNLYTASKQQAEAYASAAAGLAILDELADKPKASMSHVFGACRWFAETEVASLRDGKRAQRFCLLAVDRTGGKDLDAWQGLGAAHFLLGNRVAAIEAGNRALALLPVVKPGEPKSQQRQELEKSLTKWKALGSRT